eukprot:TRINITY_DN81628_c0_g1_i1.p1 TRINITY_DN81628_c0_g1~~TRINITY_DN81628_c0_g1_i1.p1  ORF type:complete len:345 (-),score=78.51 TRINITY_DN81628_c0_g1_i1:106-1140(-)
MIQRIFALCVFLAAALLPIVSCDEYPYSNGNFTVKEFSLGIIKDFEAGMDVNFWAPEEKGDYPVFVFASGFSDLPQTTCYDEISMKIASHGYVVVGVNKFEIPDPKKQALQIIKVLDYLVVNGADIFKSHGVASRPDIEHGIALGGHSSGNHITVQLLQESCSYVKSIVMVSPVDGLDPFGILKEFVIQEDSHGNILPVLFKTPALHILAGYDNVPKIVDGVKLTPCAPNKTSNGRFDKAWDAPIWIVNATQYGHFELVDSACKIAIKMGDICVDTKLPDKGEMYRYTSGGLTTAFLDLVFKSKKENIRFLEDRTTMPIDTITLHDYHGFDPMSVTGGGFCEHK